MTTIAQKMPEFLASVNIGVDRFGRVDITNGVKVMSHKFLSKLHSLACLSFFILMLMAVRPALAQSSQGPISGGIKIIRDQFVPHLRGTVVCCANEDNHQVPPVDEGTRDGWSLAKDGPLTMFHNAGWAWDANQPNAPISVEIFDGGALLATVNANAFRYREGIGNSNQSGYHAKDPGVWARGRPRLLMTLQKN